MQWNLICKQSDLVADAGVAAMVGDNQVALFYVPDAPEKVFAIGNWDPIGKANVLSRGLVTHLHGQWSVASPLYKQHYSLVDGQCVEQEAQVPAWPTKLVDGKVYIRQPN